MMRRARILTLLLAAGLSHQPVEGQVVTSRPGARGWIGISIDIPMVRAAPGEHGFVTITEVSEGSPAEAAGIRVGDRLISINGHGWEEGFGNPSGTLRPDDEVRMVVLREDRRRIFVLRATARPEGWNPAPVLALTVRADTMVDRMYRAMDSLRVRLATEGRTLVQVVGTRRLADSVQTVVRLREDAGLSGEARDRERVLLDREGFATFVIPELSPPFGFFTLSGELPDSLLKELESLNREIVGLRSREVSRLRTLAADEGRIDQEDLQLVQLRRALEDADRRSRDLRSVMERVARERSAEASRSSVTWTFGPDTALDSRTLRPLAPYMLGQNRAAGAEVVDLRPELAEYFDVEGGVLVVDVPPGTPAAEAGIQPGDVLTHVDGLPTPSIRALRAGLAHGGIDLTVRVVRKGRPLEVLLHRD
jgi:hypothetical protein